MNIKLWEWEREKKWNTIKRKEIPWKKFPVWMPSHSPIYEMETDFSGVRKHRKQAGPTLGGRGILA